MVHHHFEVCDVFRSRAFSRFDVRVMIRLHMQKLC
jgi:hypothetical protein